MARKRKSKPTTSARNSKQALKSRYSRAREDAQLAGLIPTVPEGALKPERVDPSTQGSQALPGLAGQAVRNGWAVPDQMKPLVVDEMVKLALDQEASPKVRTTAANVALRADQMQHERDNPERAGKAKGGTTVEVTQQVDMAKLLEASRTERMMEEAKARLAAPAGMEPSAPTQSQEEPK